MSQKIEYMRGVYTRMLLNEIRQLADRLELPVEDTMWRPNNRRHSIALTPRERDIIVAALRSIEQ